MHARIAAARSSGVAFGICVLPDAVSAKIGYATKVQLGQMAGAAEPRLAHKIPATKVPCRQAVLLLWVQLPLILPGTSRMVSPVRSAWLIAIGPSTSPTVISDLPAVSAINSGS
jgi:hypothetical protein